MSLLTKAQQNAAEIDSINTETLGFLRAQAQRAYNLANDPGEEAATMAAFGTQGAAALGTYVVLQAALTTLGQAEGIPAPNTDRFVAQPDGSVLYVPPEEPE